MLTHDQNELLNRVYAAHVSMMGKDARAKLGRIKSAVWDEQKDCLIVTYKSGDWWHYCKDGTWY